MILGEHFQVDPTKVYLVGNSWLRELPAHQNFQLGILFYFILKYSFKDSINLNAGKKKLKIPPIRRPHVVIDADVQSPNRKVVTFLFSFFPSQNSHSNYFIALFLGFRVGKGLFKGELKRPIFAT